MRESRVTINVYEKDKIVKMDTPDFINLVESLNQKVVFKTAEYFFVVVEGVSFGTWHFETEGTYGDFYTFNKKLEKSDLKEPEERLAALILKIEDFSNFKQFLTTNFHKEVHKNKYYKLQKDYAKYLKDNQGRFQAFLDGKSKGFNDFEEYSQAMDCKIPTHYAFVEFKQSPFTVRHPNDEDYQDFLNYKAGGFQNIEVYREAKRYDFTNNLDYTYFRESGCRTKQEYEENLKVLYHVPDLDKAQIAKFAAMIKDTKEKFRYGQFGEFFRLKYIFFEQLVDILYKRIFNKKLSAVKPFIEEIVK